MTGEMKADQRELRDDELDAVNGGTVNTTAHIVTFTQSVSFSVPLRLARHFFHPAPAETPTRTLRTPAVLPAAGDSSLLSFPRPLPWGSLRYRLSRLGQCPAPACRPRQLYCCGCISPYKPDPSERWPVLAPSGSIRSPRQLEQKSVSWAAPSCVNGLRYVGLRHG